MASWSSSIDIVFSGDIDVLEKIEQDIREQKEKLSKRGEFLPELWDFLSFYNHDTHTIRVWESPLADSSNMKLFLEKEKRNYPSVEINGKILMAFIGGDYYEEVITISSEFGSEALSWASKLGDSEEILDETDYVESCITENEPVESYTFVEMTLIDNEDNKYAFQSPNPALFDIYGEAQADLECRIEDFFSVKNIEELLELISNSLTSGFDGPVDDDKDAYAEAVATYREAEQLLGASLKPLGYIEFALSISKKGLSLNQISSITIKKRWETIAAIGVSLDSQKRVYLGENIIDALMEVEMSSGAKRTEAIKY